MRSRWPRLLPLFVAAFWLPFQAVAAMAMSSCRHGEVHRMAVVDDGAAEHCHTHAQAAADDSQPASLAGDACDNCEFCHLAGAGFMPAAEYVAAAMSSGRDFLADAQLAPASNIPEPPQQPPRRPA